MSEYVPTTEEVRDNYTYGASACGCCAEYRDEDYKKFDLWLAAHDAEVSAKALSDASREWRTHVNASEASYVCPEDWLRARAAEYRKAVQS